MRVFVPLLFAVAFILILGFIEVLLLRFLNRPWWEKKWVRRAALFLPLIGTGFVLAWGLSEYYKVTWLVTPSAALAALSAILLVGLMFSLPVSGLIHLVQWLLSRRSQGDGREPAGEIDPRRRTVLKFSAVAVPVITTTMGISGVTRAFLSANVYRREMVFDDLPPELDGFRILHLSDLHLRHYVTLEDLETVLLEAEPHRPDLVLVTGDIADDLSMLPTALRMIDNLDPPHGSFACLGNHEYFRGITHVHRIHDASPVPLLVDEGIRVKIGARHIHLGGIDDPRYLGGATDDFFRTRLDGALKDSITDDFLVVMSHRPDAFDVAVEREVHLVLSGHTHGGQIGLGGRSLFEPIWSNKYLWGHYRRKNSHLYTSSGMGHWFPFRLGCPPEAPVIELRRA